jgi:hypothetical protein
MAKPPPEERGSEHIQTGGGIQEVESEGGEFCGQSLNGRKGSYATEVAETQVQQGTTNAPRRVTANKKRRQDDRQTTRHIIVLFPLVCLCRCASLKMRMSTRKPCLKLGGQSFAAKAASNMPCLSPGTVPPQYTVRRQTSRLLSSQRCSRRFRRMNGL